MNKFPFSQKGFQQLQDSLYVLSDSTLHDQSILIRFDFQNWILNHFDLEQSQVEFFTSLDNEAIAFLASNTSFAIANRLPIYLEENESPITPTGNKFIRPKPELTGTASVGGNLNVEGKLTIEIGY